MPDSFRGGPGAPSTDPHVDRIKLGNFYFDYFMQVGIWLASFFLSFKHMSKFKYMFFIFSFMMSAFKMSESTSPFQKRMELFFKSLLTIMHIIIQPDFHPVFRNVVTKY